MTTPARLPADDLPKEFVDALEARLGLIEKFLEINTSYAGQGVLGRLAALENGSVSGVTTSELTGGQNVGQQSETLTASGAASPTKHLTILDGTTNASAITLAAPTASQDGTHKLIYLGVSAAHHPTISGTNIFGQSGKNGTFANLGDWLVLKAVNQKWVVLGTSITFA